MIWELSTSVGIQAVPLEWFLERIYARKSKNKNTHFKPNMAVNM
jgi:hypothetical protein